MIAKRLTRGHGWWLTLPVVALLTGWVTFALFSSRAPANGGVITAGNFKMTLGGLAWSIPTQKIDGIGANTLASQVLGDGDVLVIDQEIDGDFTGNNLRVALGVFLNVPKDVIATWYVTDGENKLHDGEAELGERLTLDGIVNVDRTEWHIIVTLKMNPGVSEYDDPSAPPPSAAPLSFGSMTITADQVRG